MAINYKPTVLIILDGFGIAPVSQSNAVASAKAPFFESLTKEYPMVLLQASSEAVGLPWGEVGNSEVGHLNIGSGILQYQSLPRINKSISTGQFFKLPALTKIGEKIKKGENKLHIMGLIGNGGIHSSQDHLEALINFAKGEKLKKKVFLHLFIDGRDTAKDAGLEFMKDTIKFCKKTKIGEIASVGGRFYGMDRNNNWDRIEKAYQSIVNGKSDKTFSDPIKAIEESYKAKVYDEEMIPVTIVGRGDKPVATIEDGDTIIFFNFRADRARQITETLVNPKFDKFETKKIKNLEVTTFTEYQKDLPVEVLFAPELIKNPIAKIFSDYNVDQLHAAETEKYAHVTFFLNGMTEAPFSGEERILVPSPSVASYDKEPAMSAEKLTDEVLKELKKDKFGFMAINFANPDMVGHTGSYKATVKAVEAVDKCLKRLIPEIAKAGGIAFVVSDHGNAEEMFNPGTGEIDKEHNMYPVPFLAVSSKLVGKPNSSIIDNDISLLTPAGILSDVAPTILKTIGLEIPKEMTGTNLF